MERINGARSALRLPIRSTILPHSDLYVYPSEDVPPDDRSMFNLSTIEG